MTRNPRGAAWYQTHAQRVRIQGLTMRGQPRVNRPPGIATFEDGRQELDDVFARLAESRFRRRFRLREAELEYLRRKGMDAVLRHADELIAARLAPADPPNDGKQTPMRGHPVFVAQHATGTCCRGCLAKWHGIPRGRALTGDERARVVAVIARWIAGEEAAAGPPPAPGQLDLSIG